MRAGDCEFCHTAEGGKPFAGGRAIDTGFGTLYTPNITPDKATGIGKWSADNLYTAMHRGLDDQGRHLYPAFPYGWYTKVAPEDIRLIKAYLDTVVPVHQANKPPELSWWLGWRGLMEGWNLINFDEGQFQSDPNKSTQWNRGAYLVEGLGHCGDCHTPKRIFGGAKKGEALQGGEWEGWSTPSLLANQRDGLGQWSAEEIAEFLKTGSTPKMAAVGRMSEVIQNSTRYLSDEDLMAIAVYLKSQPAVESTQSAAALAAAALDQGQGVFTDNCAACHMADGGGVPNVFPTLKGNPLLQSAAVTTLIRTVLNGAHMVSVPDKPTGISMPSFDVKLDDAQIAAVLNYCRNAWGNRGSLIDAAAVAKLRTSQGRQGSEQ